MVDSTVFECGLCAYSFDNSAHRPLSMPCGHVLCQQCLVHYYKGEALVCPFDLTRHPTDPYSLPSCYGILSHLPPHKALLPCSRHPLKKVKYLCTSHAQLLCSACVIDHTGADHALVQLQADLCRAKAQLKAASEQCTASLSRTKAVWSQVEAAEKHFAAFHEDQLTRLHTAFDAAVRSLQRGRREAAAALTKQKTEQLKQFDRCKQRLRKTLDEHAQFQAELGELKACLKKKDYGQLFACMHRKELACPESRAEPPQVQYWGYREHVHISLGGLVRLQEVRLLGRLQQGANENEVNKLARSPGTKKPTAHERQSRCRPRGRRHLIRKRTHSI